MATQTPSYLDNEPLPKRCNASTTSANEVKLLTAALLEAVEKRDFTCSLLQDAGVGLDPETSRLNDSIGRIYACIFEATAYLEPFVRFVQDNPRFYDEIVDISYETVHEGTVDVYITLKHHGLPELRCGEAVIILTWEKRGRQWRCVKSTGIHGMSVI